MTSKYCNEFITHTGAFIYQFDYDGIIFCHVKTKSGNLNGAPCTNTENSKVANQT